MEKPNRLYFDIETSPMLVFAWGLGKQEIDYKRIYKERQVLCIGYAFGDDPVQLLTMDYGKYDLHVRDNDADLAMVQKFSGLVEKADQVIGHNARYFDISVLRSRLIKHKLPDFSPVLIDDTYLQTKDIGFASHKLDYLTGFLDLPQKQEHPYELWLQVVSHVPGAFKRMQEYCKGDVEINRKLYKRLKPYIKSSLNLAVWNGNSQLCPHCGSKHMVIRKYKYTPVGKYPQYQCMECGHYSSTGGNQVKRASEYLR